MRHSLHSLFVTGLEMGRRHERSWSIPLLGSCSRCSSHVKLFFLAINVICSSTKDMVNLTMMKEKVEVLNLLNLVEKYASMDSIKCKRLDIRYVCI